MTFTRKLGHLLAGLFFLLVLLGLMMLKATVGAEQLVSGFYWPAAAVSAVFALINLVIGLRD